MIRIRITCVFAALLFGAAPGKGAEFGLPTDGVVVLLGDVLFAEGSLAELVEEFVRVAYPENRAQFYRIAGARATPGTLLEFFDRDVVGLRLGATHVVICVGHELVDAGAVSEGDLASFGDDLKGLVARIRSEGMQVILLTPPSADVDRNPRPRSADLNAEGIEPVADVIRAVAGAEGVAVVDWYSASLEQRQARQRTDSRFGFSRDGRTPRSEGFALAAALLLEHWGARPIRGTITLDWQTGAAQSDVGQPSVLRKDENQLTLRMDAMPMPWVVNTLRNEQTSPEWYAFRLCDIRLRITGLPEAGVMIEGPLHPLPLLPDQLTEGVNLAAGTLLAEVPDTARLTRLIATKNKLFARRLIDRVAKKPSEPELQEAFETLLRAEELYHEGYRRVIERFPRQANVELVIKTFRPQEENPGGAAQRN